MKSNINVILALEGKKGNVNKEKCTALLEICLLGFDKFKELFRKSIDLLNNSFLFLNLN